ncbi:hypothetical protein INT45_010162 [Circinella minor]|uniref:NADH dehydrogenase [ubiquinone] 1 alpha subcomplex assembly factor 3 n=1 Tax=Circinella minor TaxID=1195481 RepID=A0A8H7VS88_9FUNG|nr:hypothetical protein INT45_010162 [Circinella minor]
MALRRIAYASIGKRLFTSSTVQYKGPKNIFQAQQQQQQNDESDPDSFANQSMMSNFKNMFDRGPNVGVEIITKDGFVLSNNVQIQDPLVLLNGSAFLWRVPHDALAYGKKESLDLDAFKIFEVAAPKPELILFGTGKDFVPIPQEVRHYFFNLGIQVDQMSTKNAAATYNVLAEEGRRIALALLPIGAKQQ